MTKFMQIIMFSEIQMCWYTLSALKLLKNWTLCSSLQQKRGKHKT